MKFHNGTIFFSIPHAIKNLYYSAVFRLLRLTSQQIARTPLSACIGALRSHDKMHASVPDAHLSEPEENDVARKEMIAKDSPQQLHSRG